MGVQVSALKQKAFSILKRLFNAGLFNIFGADVINKVLVFVSGMIVVRLIPQESYGIYSYAYSILGIILLFNGLGAASAVLQFVSEKGNGTRRESFEKFGLQWGVFFDLLLCIAMFLAPFFVDFSVEGSGFFLQCWCIYPLCQLIFDVQLVSLRSTLRNSEYATCFLAQF